MRVRQVAPWVQRLGAAVVAIGGCGDPSGESASAGEGSTGMVSVTDGGQEPTAEVTSGGSTTAGSGGATESTGEEPGPTGSTGASTGSTTGRPSDPPPVSCQALDEPDVIGTCTAEAAAGSFDLDTQWEWTNPGTRDEPHPFRHVVVTPLVANLTDDDGNGQIDLCDVPDLVVAAHPGDPARAKLFILDGETGAEHGHTGPGVEIEGSVTPALGDIDGDGVPEIVALTPSRHVVALEHDLSVKWTSAAQWPDPDSRLGSLALADVDNDGDVEVVAGTRLFDHAGDLVQTFVAPSDPNIFNPDQASGLAVDLDGDDDMEIVVGSKAFHHDGSVYFNLGLGPGITTVADLDGDGAPEVLLHNSQGVSLVEHDGTLSISEGDPGGDVQVTHASQRICVVHDLDGDSIAEFAMTAGHRFGVFEPDFATDWLGFVDWAGGGGTAFDFLGDGTPESLYGDRERLFGFNAYGSVVLLGHRSGYGGTGYPVVADVDNDGSAEIVVASSSLLIQAGETAGPAIRVYRDALDRWVQARRIWNQQDYHVTNVREDGTIPSVEPHHWERLNTFRANAQIEHGLVCVPTRSER